MVSRSLEKMVLIAIGLTTVVIIGVPVLMYTMDTLNNASQFETAATLAQRIHNYTQRVDAGENDSIVIEITIPSYLEIQASNNTLSIFYIKDGNQEAEWSETYLHPITLIPPTQSGIYTLSITLQDDELSLNFT